MLKYSNTLILWIYYVYTSCPDENIPGSSSNNIHIDNSMSNSEIPIFEYTHNNTFVAASKTSTKDTSKATFKDLYSSNMNNSDYLNFSNKSENIKYNRSNSNRNSFNSFLNDHLSSINGSVNSNEFIIAPKQFNMTLSDFVAAELSKIDENIKKIIHSNKTDIAKVDYTLDVLLQSKNYTCENIQKEYSKYSEKMRGFYEETIRLCKELTSYDLLDDKIINQFLLNFNCLLDIYNKAKDEFDLAIIDNIYSLEDAIKYTKRGFKLKFVDSQEIVEYINENCDDIILAIEKYYKNYDGIVAEIKYKLGIRDVQFFRMSKCFKYTQAYSSYQYNTNTTSSTNNKYNTYNKYSEAEKHNHNIYKSALNICNDFETIKDNLYKKLCYQRQMEDNNINHMINMTKHAIEIIRINHSVSKKGTEYLSKILKNRNDIVLSNMQPKYPKYFYDHLINQIEKSYETFKKEIKHAHLFIKTSKLSKPIRIAPEKTNQNYF